MTRGAQPVCVILIIIVIMVILSDVSIIIIRSSIIITFSSIIVTVIVSVSAIIVVVFITELGEEDRVACMPGAGVFTVTACGNAVTLCGGEVIHVC